MRSNTITSQTKAIKEFFPLVLLKKKIMLYKVDLNMYHSNTSLSLAVQINVSIPSFSVAVLNKLNCTK